MSSNNPADGERRAVGGYYPQYQVAAYKIWQCLRGDELQWIRVADPEAGRVDDFQVGFEARVDAYQVKWAQQGGTLTFRDLAAPSQKSPCLIAQLADGWRRLHDLHPGSRVVVHLLTNQVPSVSDKPPAGSPPPSPSHFAAFLEQAWLPFKAGLSESSLIPLEWRAAWDALQQASGLDRQAFESFVRDCELDLSYRFVDEQLLPTGDRDQVRRDLEQLSQFLFRTVAGPQRVVEMSREHLVHNLGWGARFSPRSRHSFPVDHARYERIQATAEHVVAALKDLSGGYIALLGSPGSGKSTLLTQELRQGAERVIRYYAFVPDARDPRSLRGESVSFLHDVVLALEKAGFRTGSGPAGLDRAQLIQRFHDQLDLLHSDWQNTSRKTILVVDGLDHIEREQRPERSLLADLPDPDEVPDGVIILLGSQTDELPGLPDRVQHEIRQHERRVSMSPLTRSAVRCIVERCGHSVPPTVHDAIFQHCEGHPLALGLLLNRLSDAANAEEVATILKEAEPYRGNIEAHYHSYWRQIEKDDALAHLLGLVARLRGPIDLHWLLTWAEQDVVGRFQRSTSHYFRREKHRWFFFHNSFQIFLVNRTARVGSAEFDPFLDRRFHAELADVCSKSGLAPWSWEAIYHRCLAGQDEYVMQQATPTVFRDQLLELRPIEAVKADIDICLRSAARHYDPLSLSRLILAGSEMHQRSYQLDTSVASLLLRMGEVSIATEHLRDGNSLRVNRAFALHSSVDFLRVGVESEAQRLFELGEPLDLLEANERSPGKYDREAADSLLAWSYAAVCFRPIADIAATIRKLAFRAENPASASDPSRIIQDRMLVRVGRALLDLNRWADLETLEAALDSARTEDRSAKVTLLLAGCEHCVAAGDPTRAESMLSSLLAEPNIEKLDVSYKLRLAECIFRVRKDLIPVRELLEGTSLPYVGPREYQLSSGLAPFMSFLRYWRLSRLVGQRESATSVIDQVECPDFEKMRFFHLCLAGLADMSADALAGRHLDAAQISQRVLPFARPRSFQADGMDFYPCTSWRAMKDAGAELYPLLVREVARHGPEGLEALRADLESAWSEPSEAIAWHPDWRRATILALASAGCSREWCASQLRLVRQSMFEEEDVAGKIAQCHRQAAAWLELGEPMLARESLRMLLEVSYGVGYRKDYQLEAWIEWLPIVNRLEPQRAAARIRWFAQAVTTLLESTEGRAAGYAGEDLLRICFAWSPRSANKLFWWLINNHVLHFADGLEVLLSRALASSKPPAQTVEILLTELLIPFSTVEHGALTGRLIEESVKKEGKTDAARAAKNLLDHVRLAALGTSRAGWIRGIAAAARELGLSDGSLEKALGEDLADDATEDKSEDDRAATVRLGKEGPALTATQLRERLHSASDLLEMWALEQPDSYFDWTGLMSEVAQTADLDEVATLAEHAGKRRGAARNLAILSGRALALGDRRLAWQLGERALSAASHYGWSGMLDGERINAFEALARVDPEKARSLAYSDLVRSLVSDFPYPENIAPSLRVILPLISTDPPWQAVWDQLEAQVRLLFGHSALPDASELCLDDQIPDDTPAMVLCDFIVECAVHAVRSLAQAAQRSCAKLILLGDSAMVDRTSSALSQGEDQQEALLPVLDAVAERQSSALNAFQNALVELSASRNYAVRRAALRLRGDCGHVQPPSSPSLPAEYRLSLPSRTIAIAGEDVPERGTPAPDSSDPERVVRPFNADLRAVAQLAGVSETGVLLRAADLMEQMAPRSVWSAAGENELRKVVDSSGLGLSFRRPRALLARRALFQIVAELRDAGALDAEAMASIERRLRYFDPQMLLEHRHTRPGRIKLLPIDSHSFGIDRKWWDRITSSRDMLARHVDGRVVLAEITKSISLEWETPEEERLTVVTPSSGLLIVGRPSSLLPQVEGRLRNEYASLIGAELMSSVLIRHAGQRFDSPGADWIALNPELGRRLGWCISPSGLFRWHDGSGATTVETLWWTEGGFHRQPPHHRDQVAEGWLVLASAPAVEAIGRHLGPLRRVVSITRSTKQNIAQGRVDVFSEPVG